MGTLRRLIHTPFEVFYTLILLFALLAGPGKTLGRPNGSVVCPFAHNASSGLSIKQNFTLPEELGPLWAYSWGVGKESQYLYAIAIDAEDLYKEVGSILKLAIEPEIKVVDSGPFPIGPRDTPILDPLKLNVFNETTAFLQSCAGGCPGPVTIDVISLVHGDMKVLATTTIDKVDYDGIFSIPAAGIFWQMSTGYKLDLHTFQLATVPDMGNAMDYVLGFNQFPTSPTSPARYYALNDRGFVLEADIPKFDVLRQSAPNSSVYGSASLPFELVLDEKQHPRSLWWGFDQSFAEGDHGVSFSLSDRDQHSTALPPSGACLFDLATMQLDSCASLYVGEGQQSSQAASTKTGYILGSCTEPTPGVYRHYTFIQALDLTSPLSNKTLRYYSSGDEWLYYSAGSLLAYDGGVLFIGYPYRVRSIYKFVHT